MTVAMVDLGVGIALDRYALLLLLFAALIGRFKTFILDWFPILFLWLSYDFLRGFADNLSGRIHFLELINLEKAIFGSIPTIELQKYFFNPNQLSFLDYLSTVVYFLHFALPLAFGFVLWLDQKAKFRQFITGILILSYSGWVTYVIYPSAPPWMSNDLGYLVGITKILNLTLATFPERLALPTIYHQFNPNPVAAIPSMHAAYPLLVFLYATLFYKRKGLYILPYVFFVWFTLVYLGEHYFIDVLAGAIYAFTAFLVANWILHNVKFHSWLKKKQGKHLGWSVMNANPETTLPKKTP